MTKRLTKLNARWNEVTSLVYARTCALEHLSSQYGELKTLMVSESGYLDKLDKLLRKSPENAADAEEISEELDVRMSDEVKNMKVKLFIYHFRILRITLEIILQNQELKRSRKLEEI